MNTKQRVRTCNLCPRRQGDICTGQSLFQRIREQDCPESRFGAAEPPPAPAPPAPVAPRPLAPLPRQQWPVWARALELLRTLPDAGVGDTVHRLLGSFGAAYESALRDLGVPCGCSARRADWNVLYSYGGPI